jgi:hypothetical protein
MVPRRDHRQATGLGNIDGSLSDECKGMREDRCAAEYHAPVYSAGCARGAEGRPNDLSNGIAEVPIRKPCRPPVV